MVVGLIFRGVEMDGESFRVSGVTRGYREGYLRFGLTERKLEVGSHSTKKSALSIKNKTKKYFGLTSAQEIRSLNDWVSCC